MFIFLFLMNIFTLNANEFIVPKKIIKRTSASKIKEDILGEIGDVLKNLIKLDAVSLQLRNLMQNQFELGLLGTKDSSTGSGNKVELSKNLATVKSINEMLLQQLEEMEVKLKDLQKKFKTKGKN